MIPTRRPRWPAVLAVLLLVAGAGLWLVRRPGRPTQPEEQPAPDEPAPVQPSRRPPVFRSTPVADTPAEPSWFAQPGLPRREIAGKVSRDGQPAAGAEVVLESAASAANPALRKRTTSGKDGAFSFGLQPAGLYDLTAYAPERQPAHVEVDPRNPLAEPRPDRVVLELLPCQVTISGLVTDRGAGTPVIGGRVVLLPSGSPSHLVGPTTVTGSTGDYTMCVPSGRTLRFRVEAGGRATTLVEVTPDERRDVQLEGEAIVACTTVDAVSGAPLGGVQVNASPFGTGDAAAAPATTLSDASGHFELRGLYPRTRYIVNEWRADYAAEEPLALDVGSGRSTLVRRLGPASRIEGVVQQQGRPVTGARVRFDRSRTSSSFTSISQTDGRFTLRGVPRGTGTMTVEGFRVLAPARLEVTAPEYRDVVVEVEPLGR